MANVVIGAVLTHLGPQAFADAGFVIPLMRDTAQSDETRLCHLYIVEAYVDTILQLFVARK